MLQNYLDPPSLDLSIIPYFQHSLSDFDPFCPSMATFEPGKKHTALPSIESWLFNGDPYVMVYEDFVPYIPLNNQVPFFYCAYLDLLDM